MTRTPVVLVTGLHMESMAATTMALQWDLPKAVVVRHTIDARTSQLHRMVSDVSGIVEEAWIDLEHACTNCALREDIIPTLERMAASNRWETIIAHLPISCEALQVCRVAAQRRSSRTKLQIASIVTAVDGATVIGDVLGDDLLRERDLETSSDDGRGVGETLATMVEYADVIAAMNEVGSPDAELLDSLKRPDAVVVDGVGLLDAGMLVRGLHRHRRSEDWIGAVRRGDLALGAGEHVWTTELTSWRPFHPGRLLANIEALGGGPHRSRGCFWVPSRPHDIGGWEGAGGQVSVGITGHWDGEEPLTRLIVSGIGEGRAQLEEVFERTLLSDDELSSGTGGWVGRRDGLEPWLGEIAA